jgi:hypothetical protein
MARTIRTIPHWASEANKEESSPRFARYYDRAARGQDGAVHSEIAQSAKDGKRDDWSTAPKGRANKRVATKAIRRYNNAEVSRIMEAERMEDHKEAQEAKRKASERAFLQMALEWAEEDRWQAESDLRFAISRIENIRAKLAELD